jgi:transposase
LSEYGHEVKLMAPAFVKPYVKSNKNDRNDAEAICEAVTRPTQHALCCDQDTGATRAFSS